MNSKDQVRVAIIDMNNAHPNQGMRGIQEILMKYGEETGIDLHYTIFSPRDKGALPGLDFDIYISSGGPGSPWEGEGTDWENNFFNLLDQLDAYNAGNTPKKHLFLICHSFQLACRKYKLGTVTNRKSTAFGIFPIHLTGEGLKEPVFEGLGETFFSVDSRDWQVIAPVKEDFEAKGASILAIEKERPHVDLERCIMAIRFSDTMIGTQFHPEADPEGMTMYLGLEEKRKLIIDNHGTAKYEDMLSSLQDPARIMLTQRVILPNFLNQAIGSLTEVYN